MQLRNLYCWFRCGLRFRPLQSPQQMLKVLNLPNTHTSCLDLHCSAVPCCMGQLQFSFYFVRFCELASSKLWWSPFWSCHSKLYEESLVMSTHLFHHLLGLLIQLTAYLWFLHSAGSPVKARHLGKNRTNKIIQDKNIVMGIDGQSDASEKKINLIFHLLVFTCFPDKRMHSIERAQRCYFFLWITCCYVIQQRRNYRRQ